MEYKDYEEFYTVKEFAKLLKMNPETIRKAIRAKKIIALKPGGGQTSSLRIPRVELNRMAQTLMYGEK
jgi:excisionase family DNA binding protein